MSKDDVVLAGNNEDYTLPNTKIWFRPASDGAYGRVYVGYDRTFSPYQGGMNVHGLFMDMNAVESTGWQADPGQPTFSGDLAEHLLTKYSSVQEVVDFFQHYNVQDLDQVRVPVADAQGRSAIIEWGGGALQIINKQGRYQISTNFIQSDYGEIADYPCHRYQIANQILGDAPEPSVALIRRVLSATHFEGHTQTLYSNICDLVARRIYLYHFHNFEEVVVFDLGEELEKGAAAYPIPSLFEVRPFSAHLWRG